MSGYNFRNSRNLTNSLAVLNSRCKPPRCLGCRIKGFFVLPLNTLLNMPVPSQQVQSILPVSFITLNNVGKILPGLLIGVPRTFPAKIGPIGGMSQDSGPISLVQKWHLARAWGARVNQRPTAHHPLHTHYGSLVEEPPQLS
jgi:hypothetical protein